MPYHTIEQWALIVATVTLAAVVTQILLARAELAAVNADLALANRRAELFVTASPLVRLQTGLPVGSKFEMNLRVHNRGSRTNREARLKLGLLDGWGPCKWPTGRVTVDPDAFGDSLLPKGYSAYSFLLHGPFFPEDSLDFNSMAFEHETADANVPAPEPIHYRIIFEDGAYPKLGDSYAILSNALPE